MISIYRRQMMKFFICFVVLRIILTVPMCHAFPSTRTFRSKHTRMKSERHLVLSCMKIKNDFKLLMAASNQPDENKKIVEKTAFNFDFSTFVLASMTVLSVFSTLHIIFDQKYPRKVGHDAT